LSDSNLPVLTHPNFPQAFAESIDSEVDRVSARYFLIAAAPDLFVALEALLDTVPFASNPQDKQIHEQARVALAKAKGVR
jgi:hypothetical protein